MKIVFKCKTVVHHEHGESARLVVAGADGEGHIEKWIPAQSDGRGNFVPGREYLVTIEPVKTGYSVADLLAAKESAKRA